MSLHRVTSDRLEELAHAHHAEIELDPESESEQAYLNIGRDTYYADLIGGAA